jgi:hypothetical protein
MLNSPRNTKAGRQLIFVLLIITTISQSCNFIAPPTIPVPSHTAEPEYTPTSQPAIAPTNTSTPMQTASPAPTSTQTETIPEAQPGVVVINTGDPEFADAAVFRGGGVLVAMTETDATGSVTDVTGAIFITPDGKSIVMDFENGLPARAIVEDHLVEYSNYTDSTVDITVVSPDGTVSTNRSIPFDASKIHKVTAGLSPNNPGHFQFVDFSSIGLPKDVDWMWYASTVLGVGGCAIAVILLHDVSLLADAACALFVINKYFELTGKEAPLLLKGTGLVASGVSCNLGLFSNNPVEFTKAILVACNKFLLDLTREIRKSAQKKGKVLGAYVDTRTLEGVLGTVNVGSAFCRYGPGKAYLPLYDLFQGDKVKIDGRDFINSSLWVQPENQDGHCWAIKSVFDIVGDISTLPIVQPNLPKTPYAMPPTGVRATRDSDNVTISWDTADYIPAVNRRGYLLELFVCQNGFFVWLALNPEENSITVQDEEGCDPQSNGQVYVVNVLGYSDPTQILPWP